MSKRSVIIIKEKESLTDDVSYVYEGCRDEYFSELLEQMKRGELPTS